MLQKSAAPGGPPRVQWAPSILSLPIERGALSRGAGSRAFEGDATLAPPPPRHGATTPPQACPGHAAAVAAPATSGLLSDERPARRNVFTSHGVRRQEPDALAASAETRGGLSPRRGEPFATATKASSPHRGRKSAVSLSTSRACRVDVKSPQTLWAASAASMIFVAGASTGCRQVYCRPVLFPLPLPAAAIRRRTRAANVSRSKQQEGEQGARTVAARRPLTPRSFSPAP
jgi:hypothetical protein